MKIKVSRIKYIAIPAFFSILFVLYAFHSAVEQVVQARLATGNERLPYYCDNFNSTDSQTLPTTATLEKVLNWNSGFIPGTTIPRIIHAAWVGPVWKIPEAYTRSQESFTKQNPGYLYVLWEEADIEVFVERFFPKEFDFFQVYTYSCA